MVYKKQCILNEKAFKVRELKNKMRKEISEIYNSDLEKDKKNIKINEIKRKYAKKILEEKVFFDTKINISKSFFIHRNDNGITLLNLYKRKKNNIYYNNSIFNKYFIRKYNLNKNDFNKINDGFRSLIKLFNGNKKRLKKYLKKASKKLKV